MDQKVYKGSCFCGTVEFTVTGKPDAMGYCHCESCRHWSAGPVNAFTLWKPTVLQITRGAENIGTYNKTPQSSRKWCKTCGGHIFSEHPGWNLIDVFAPILQNFSLPTSHSRALPGIRAAHRGRTAQNERRSDGNGRLGHQHRGINLLSARRTYPHGKTTKNRRLQFSPE